MTGTKPMTTKTPETIQCPTCGASVAVSIGRLLKSPRLMCPQGHAIQVRAEKAKANRADAQEARLPLEMERLVGTKMQALLIDGPFENQHYEVADPPPDHITPEAILSADAVLMEIARGQEFPEARFERHGYRLLGVDHTLSPTPNGDHRLPVYGHIPGGERTA